MPAGPGWPGSGLVVAAVSLFGVGPGWYRFRGGFARLCVWVGPVWYHIPPPTPNFFFLTNLSPGENFWGFFREKFPNFRNLGDATPNAPQQKGRRNAKPPK